MSSQLSRYRREGETSGILQDLSDSLSSDNLFEKHQAVESSSGVANGQGAKFLIHFRHNLPGSCVRDKHKLSGSCDLGFFKRYCS